MLVVRPLPQGGEGIILVIRFRSLLRTKAQQLSPLARVVRVIHPAGYSAPHWGGWSPTPCYRLGRNYFLNKIILISAI